MAQKNIADLTSEANVIRDETNAGANTKLRVRNMLINIIDSFINNDRIDTDNSLSTSNKTVAGRDAVKAYIAAQIAAIPSNFLGLYTSLGALESAHATANSGNWAIVDPGSGTDAVKYLWDEDEGWVQGGGGGAGTWGSITGTLSDQTDLQSVLDAKEAHTNTAVALTDAASIDITGPVHTLTTANSRTFTDSYTGNDATIEITLNATTATMTFPSGALCISEGVASGDNALDLSGVSGDKYVITRKKVGSSYYVVAKNMNR